MDHVRCFRRVDGHTARWAYAMYFVRDICLIYVHIVLWTYAMDFVRDSGCYHSEVAPTGFACRICSHIANQICEPDLWPWKVPVLEYYRSGVALTGFANWICSYIAERICEPICGPRGLPCWSATTARQHPPDLRTGFAVTLRTGLANRICGPKIMWSVVFVS